MKKYTSIILVISILLAMVYSPTFASDVEPLQEITAVQNNEHEISSSAESTSSAEVASSENGEITELMELTETDLRNEYNKYIKEMYSSVEYHISYIYNGVVYDLGADLLSAEAFKAMIYHLTRGVQFVGLDSEKASSGFANLNDKACFEYTKENGEKWKYYFDINNVWVIKDVVENNQIVTYKGYFTPGAKGVEYTNSEGNPDTIYIDMLLDDMLELSKDKETEEARKAWDPNKAQYMAKAKIEDLIKVDEMIFSFELIGDLEGYLTERIGNVGEMIKATFEHFYVKERKRTHYYLLTFEGSKSSVTLWTEEQYGFEQIPSADNAIIGISFSCQVIDGECRSLKGCLEKTPFSVDGVFQNGELKSVELGYYVTPLGDLIETRSITTNNCSYTVYEENDITMDEAFKDTDKDSYIAEQKDRLESNKKDEDYDLERLVTTLKRTREDGRVFDYYISFVSELPLSTKSLSWPWLKELGDDVKVTMLGLSLTADGKEYTSYTLLRFSGSKDSIWFRTGSTDVNIPSDGYVYVDNSYESLISFDGIKYVYNSLSHYTLDAKIVFSDTDRELISIKLLDGSKEISTDSSKIKYIGGGKATYEKFW